MKWIAIISCFMLSLTSVNEITTDLQEKATREHKNIAVYFCGSDWCSVCTKFKRETLSDPQVDSLLNNGFIYYLADFPQAVKQSKELVAANEFLAEKLNPAGEFPVLVIADKDWNIKAKIYRGNKQGEVTGLLKQFGK